MKRFGPLTIVAPAIVLLSCFGGLLGGGRTFVFRDSGHYYYPLWQWITRQWHRGEFPCWNPYENAGAPLAADATASLFYPGKLLFLLPLPFDVLYNLFLLAHFVLAFWFTLRAARRFKLKLPAATLAALAYTFSGSVLMQHANAPYLIGAAWLPLALSSSYGMLRDRSWPSALALSLALAMMTLGGDVQSAYHTLLVLVLAWWFLRGRDWDQTAAFPWHRRRPMLLAGCGVLAFGLAAVQILPSSDWTASTVRAAYHQPRNVYEAMALDSGAGAAANGIFGTPPKGSHHEASYDFSLAPWRWPELLWPNVSGKMYPVNRRWLSAIPGEGRVWSASLYLGVIPLLLALSVLRFRRGRPIWKWLSWLALLSLLASLGWYGLGWVVHEIDYAWRGDLQNGPAIGPQVGGLYWFFSTVLPGYVYFRYPAKWFTFTSLAISLLAGYGLQANLRRFTRRARRVFAGGAMLSVVGLLAVTLFRESWSKAVSTAPADAYFGPLDPAGAWTDLIASGCQSLVIASFGFALLRWSNKHPWKMNTAGLIVLATAVDLAIAQHWLAPTAPVSLWQEPSSLVLSIERVPTGAAPRVYRSRSPSLLPPQWSQRSSPDRLVEGMQWERDTLHPKHYLANGIESISVSTAMESYGHAVWLALAESQSRKEQSQLRLEDLSVTHLILPVDESRVVSANSVVDERNPHVMVVANPNPLPRLRLSRNVNALPPLERESAEAIKVRTKEVMSLLTTAHTVVLESSNPGLRKRLAEVPTAAILPGEHAAIVGEQANRIEIKTKFAEPAVLVLADTFTDDWRAEIECDGQSFPAEIYRANRLFRGILVPAGDCRIVMSYRPASLRAGAWISGLSWLLLLLFTGGRYIARG